MSDLYQEIILDHAHNPRNFGALEHHTHVGKDANASCGDMLEMQLEMKDGKIAKVGWRGVGCAISTASASMVSEMIIGKSLKQAQGITKEQLLEHMGMDTILPTREKCLMLPIKTLLKVK